MSAAFEKGATTGTKTYNEETSMPEHASSADITKPNDKSALDARGSVGKQFTTDGVLGGLAQKIGGPLDKDGTVGKQFTESGILGGTAQKFADLGADGKARAAKS
ncbi:hypothetical protein LTR92_007762 [Exophiala xenobiotica]|nr:hypothetical protein LTR92_007762 [Exophiala xenobiotica]